MVRPNFSRARVADLDTFEGHIQNLIDNIPERKTVDLQPLFFRLTLDSATEFLLGESVHSLSSGDLPQEIDFGYQFDYAQTGLTKRTRLGPFYWTHRDAKFDYACKFCHDLVDRFVYKALEKRQMEAVDVTGEVSNSGEKRGKYVFINELAKQTDDPITLRNEAMNILIAGRDTTASLLSNLFVMLAKHPHVWAKLRNEVLELDGRMPDYETLRGMRYLKFVLNEGRFAHPYRNYSPHPQKSTKSTLQPSASTPPSPPTTVSPTKPPRSPSAAVPTGSPQSSSRKTH
jgi:cytochrome P450